MPISVLHDDADLVAVDKPPGVLVHRGWGDDEEAALGLVRDTVGTFVWPVHRLDRGASGVLLFAKNREAARVLSGAFESGQVEKRYLALVRGVPADEGVVDYPIPRREDGPRVPASPSGGGWPPARWARGPSRWSRPSPAPAGFTRSGDTSSTSPTRSSATQTTARVSSTARSELRSAWTAWLCTRLPWHFRTRPPVRSAS